MGFWNAERVQSLISCEGCHLHTALGRVWVTREPVCWGSVRLTIGLMSGVSEEQAAAALNMLRAKPPRMNSEIIPANG